MTCYSPVQGWLRVGGGFTRSRHDAFTDMPRQVPCGGCIGCRLGRAQSWMVRCVHEASLHEENCMATLTYDDQHLDADYSVNVRDVQLFFKRLRKQTGVKLRFFCGAEYGPKSRRPHYHALIFGWMPLDGKVFSPGSGRGKPLYVSQFLTTTWGKGFCSFVPLTPESAAYAARYSMKKVNGDRAESHYEWVHPVTGEVVRQRPEFATMSRRPGIGAEWFSKFGEEVFPDDFVVVNGRKCGVPRFYFDRLDEVAREEVRLSRLQEAADPDRKWNNTAERLEVRAEVARAKVLQRKGSIE